MYSPARAGTMLNGKKTRESRKFAKARLSSSKRTGSLNRCLLMITPLISAFHGVPATMKITRTMPTPIPGHTKSSSGVHISGERESWLKFRHKLILLAPQTFNHVQWNSSQYTIQFCRVYWIIINSPPLPGLHASMAYTIYSLVYLSLVGRQEVSAHPPSFIALYTNEIIQSEISNQHCLSKESVNDPRFWHLHNMHHPRTKHE